MKLESELNREYAIELSKLILDNPKMRVIGWRALYDNFPELFEKSLQMEAECEHDTTFANGKKLADYTAEFKAADEMERISIPLFV